MSETAKEPRKGEIQPYRKTLRALYVVFAVYILLLLLGLPQKWTTAQFVAHEESVEVVEVEETLDSDQGAKETVVEDFEIDASLDKSEDAEDLAERLSGEERPIPPQWTAIPFVALLLCIAVLPLVPATEHWWESNLHRFLSPQFSDLSRLDITRFSATFPSTCTGLVIRSSILRQARLRWRERSLQTRFLANTFRLLFFCSRSFRLRAAFVSRAI